jgi:competence protein ComFC
MFKQKIKAAANKFLNAVYPQGLSCLCCAKELQQEDSYLSICEDCMAQLPYVNGEGCPVCGSELLGIDKKCRNCSSFAHYFDKVHSVFWYKGFIKQVVVGYKDQGKTYWGQYIARFFFYLLKTQSISADCFAYVPASAKARRRRGFDPMERVARLLSELTGIPYFHILKRKDAGADLAKSGREERLAQIKGQYSLAPAFDNKLISDKTVLLLDDVVTTAATADECCKLIKRLGAKSVSVLSFARA